MIQDKYTILIVHNHYRIPGGEDSVVENEKKLLEQKGHKVVLYTRNNNEIQEQGGVARIKVGLTAIFSIQTYRDIKKAIKQEKIDIIHVHNTLSLVSPSVYYAALSCNIPIVQTVHNFRLICPGALLYKNEKVCEECISKGLNRAVRYGCYRNSRMQTLVSALSLFIHRKLGVYRKMYYICLTDFNKNKLLEANKKGKIVFLPQNIYVKPNFTYEIVKEECSERLNQFVYIGRLEKEKGIRMLLEAWKEISDKKLIICGSGTQEKWCREFIQKQGMTNVDLMGQVPKDRVLELINGSQALIFTSQLYEGFPMTIVESFSCGTPVIVNDIGNGSSLVQDGVNGRKFKRDSKEDLVRTIQEWKGGMYRETKEIFQQKFSPEKNYEILKNIYDSILQKQKAKK